MLMTNAQDWRYARSLPFTFSSTRLKFLLFLVFVLVLGVPLSRAQAQSHIQVYRHDHGLAEIFVQSPGVAPQRGILFVDPYFLPSGPLHSSRAYYPMLWSSRPPARLYGGLGGFYGGLWWLP
jgi:hypothetical protein